MTFALRVGFGIWLAATMAWGQMMQPADLWKRPVAEADRKLAYGSGELQFGELRLPKAKGLVPVVVLVHGGCWMDRLPGRDARDTSLEPMRPLAVALADAGVATWNVEYRRMGNAGGGWPGTYQDLGAAVDHLRSIAGEYRLDLKRVVVVGHSSGGQLAHWIWARGKLPSASAVFGKNPLPVRAVMNLDGPPDLADAQPLERQFCGGPAITKFLEGAPAQQPERYREGSAKAWLPIGVSQWIVSGGLLQMAGDFVSSYEALAKEKGETVNVLRLEGAGHFDMLAPEGPQGKPVLDMILKLVR